MKHERGVIVQDAGVPPERWQVLADCGCTHAMIFVPWCRFEPTPGDYTLEDYAERIQCAQSAGLQVILRLVWPVPDWAPSTWAARNPNGISSFDRERLLRLGRCPSMWCDEAWAAVYRAQNVLVAAFPGIELSPPGSGGGEWTHPTTHFFITEENWAAVALSLWCFDENALAAWHRAYASGEVGTPEPPSGFPEAWKVRGFTRWYCGALERRLREAVSRTPGPAWLALIARGDYQDMFLCAGTLGLDRAVEELGANVIISCLFGRGNDDQSRAYCFDQMERYHGAIAVGMERWQGMERNVLRVARTPVTHLLVGSEGLLAEGLETFRYWSRWWLANTRN